MINLCIGIAIILVASTVCRYLSSRNWSKVPSEAERRIVARMDELDRRLTDIQDVMITIDEKLSRERVHV